MPMETTAKVPQELEDIKWLQDYVLAWELSYHTAKGNTQLTVIKTYTQLIRVVKHQSPLTQEKTLNSLDIACKLDRIAR